MKFLQKSALVALIMAILSLNSIAIAAPPEGKGGGNNKGGGITADSHFVCNYAIPNMNSVVRPAVSNDGSVVYVADVNRNLYAVSSNDCGLRWKQENAGSKAVAVGDDGTIYTGTSAWVKAFNEDGSIKWTYTFPVWSNIFNTLGVGPDGNIYVVTTWGLGVFALSPDGELLWNTHEDRGKHLGPTELHFSGTQLGYTANDRSRVLNLSDGSVAFTLGGGYYPIKTSLFDGNWHMKNSSYSSTGDLQWTFGGGMFEGFSTPAVDGNGVSYMTASGGSMYAVNPDGSQRWATTPVNLSFRLDVDPTNSIVILPAGGSNNPASLQAYSAANGKLLWGMEFPIDEFESSQFVDGGVSFNADGTQAYVVTSIAAPSLGAPRAYLNIVNTTGTESASTILRSSNITLDVKSGGRGVSFTGTVYVVDENKNPVDSANVSIEWTLPDGTVVVENSTTSGNGTATFRVRGEGGGYTLTVTNISKDGYAFDSSNSKLSATRYWF